MDFSRPITLQISTKILTCASLSLIKALKPSSTTASSAILRVIIFSGFMVPMRSLAATALDLFFSFARKVEALFGGTLGIQA